MPNIFVAVEPGQDSMNGSTIYMHLELFSFRRPDFEIQYLRMRNEQ